MMEPEEAPIPNQETEAAMLEARAMVTGDGPRYKTLEEIFEALNKN